MEMMVNDKMFYDEDGYLSFIKIANQYEMDPNTLRESLLDYIYSLNEDELRFAYDFNYSVEAQKMRNIHILRHRVNGFSEKLVKKLYFNEELLKKIENQLLDSIPSIYNDYVNNKSNQR